MKTSRTLRVTFASFLLACLGLVPLQAQITWTGAADDHDLTNNANWSAPLAGTGSDDVTFGSSMDYVVYTPIGGAQVRDITFNGSEREDYTIGGTWALTLNGNVAVASSPGNVKFESGLYLQLSDTSHTIDVTEGTSVWVAGQIDGDGNNSAVVKNGAGTLRLDGANTFLGGLTLNAGWLLLGSSSSTDVESTPPVRWGPVGRGTLTLSGGTLAPVADITLNNPVALALSGSVKLGDCDTNNSITFAGNISGTGAFDVHGYGDVVFNGNNSGWSGGIAFYGDNDVYANSATALGTGPVTFATYDNETYLLLNASTTINGLSGGYYSSGEGNYGSEIHLNQNVALTINQASGSAEYSGSIYGYNNEGGYDGGLTKNGAGTLVLSGANEYHGSTQVNAGTLIIDGANNGYLDNSAVSVNSGSALGVINDGNIYSTVTVASGAKLFGNGFVADATIQAGGILSPGTTSCPVGELNFNDLTLAGQSTIVVGVKSDGSGNLENSTIRVQNSETLTLSGIDAAHPLSLKLISDGLLGGLVENQPYTVSFLNFQNQTGTALDNTNVDFSLSTLDTGFANVTYSIALVGNDYVVTFTPVPEPSTYALMALGLAGTGLAAWRKRRRA